MRNLNNTTALKALLLAGCAGSFFMAAPAMAQAAGGSGEGPDCKENPTDPRCATPAPGAGAAGGSGTIVVTGSRIARADYTSNSPTVTVDERFLKESSTGAIEQQLNKLPQFVVSQSSTVQNVDNVLTFAGGDIQPNASHTPGASNVSLRGVGANRSLVLIDGRRGTPGNATGVVDVSTIPNAAIERVEIISGGASATYGADAVAGVTNFILKKNFQGLELDAQGGLSQAGNAFEYQLSGLMGTDFPDGRGNVMLAMSLNTRELALQKDNRFFRDLWANPNTTGGAFFFAPRPAISGLGLLPNAVNPATGVAAAPGTAVCDTTPQGCVLTNYFASRGANPGVPNNTGTIYLNEDGSIFTGVQAAFVNDFNSRGGVVGFQPWATRDSQVGAIWSTTALGTIKVVNGLTPQTVPTDRYNFLARGNYEITDFIGVFFQGGFSQSNTHTVQEPGSAQGGWDVIVPWGPGKYTGTVTNGPFNPAYTNPFVPPSSIPNTAAGAPAGSVIANPAFIARYRNILPCATPGNAAYNPTGCTNTEAFQGVVPAQAAAFLTAAGKTQYNLGGFLPLPRISDTEVRTYNLVAGLEGSIPGTDWTWEAFVNHGISQTIARLQGFYSTQRERAVFTAPNFGQGFRAQDNQLSGGFGATTATCTTGLRFFQAYQGVSQDCYDAISQPINTRGTARQTIAEVNLQGGLFDLPAGQLRFAAGASYREERYEFITDLLIGNDFLQSNVGNYASANMENQGYDVKELYGELLVPVLKDIPLVKEFNLELGGRMSNYTTTGTSYTFKALADWQVTDWLRFRGGFNRAERAPNINELLLTPQQTYASDPIGDVCSTRNQSTLSANPTANTTNALDVQAMCLALMARDSGIGYVSPTATNSYYNPDPAVVLQRQPAGTGGGSAFPTTVGNQYYRNNINPNLTPLKPEVADTITVGAVIRAPFSSGPLSRLNLTVDYFNIKIKDPIGNSGGGGVLLRCVSPAFNPAAAGVAAGATSAAGLDAAAIQARANAAIQQSSCPTVTRAQNDSTTSFGGFSGALTTFDNQGLIKLSGIDATLSWGQDIGPGSLFVSLNGNYMFHFQVQPFEGTPLLDYVGTQGTGLKGLNFGSSFEYKIFGTIGYTWGPASLSLQWQHTPAAEDTGDVNFLNGRPGATALNNIAGQPAYNLFSLNGSYQVTDDIRLRFGVDNLFNRTPDLIGYQIVPAANTLRGGSYSFFEDQQGRRFSFGANVRF